MTRVAHGLQLVGSAIRLATATRLGGHTRIITREHPLHERLPLPSENGDETQCITALPASAVLSRHWHLPSAGAGQLRQMVGHRLEADLPVPLDEFAWEFRAGVAADAQVPIVAQAVRRTHLERYTRELADAGYTPDCITTEGEALAALYRLGLHPDAPPERDALLLVEPEAWHLALFEHGQLASARRIAVETNQTEQLVRQVLQILQRECPHTPLPRLLLCATDTDTAPRETLAVALQMPVEPVATPGDLRNEHDQPLAPAELALFGPAIGLALAGLEEQPGVLPIVESGRATAMKPRDWQARIAARPWLWAGVAAAALLAALGVHVGALAWETNRMQGLLDELGPNGEPMAPLQDRVIAMQRIERFRLDVAELVTHLAGPVPNSIILTNIQISRDRGLLLKGKAPAPQAAYQLADALRSSGVFDRVNPESIGGGEFVIRADIVDVQPLPSPTGGPQWR